MGIAKKTNGNVAPENPADKRLWPRYPLSTAVEAVDIGGNTRIRGRLVDIARKGCFIDTISPFATKAAVTLTITKDNQSFKTEADVIYSQRGMGMGLMFTATAPDQLLLLKSWLEVLGAAEAAGPSAIADGPHPGSPKSTGQVRDIVAELIALLTRKNILNNPEKEDLMRRLTE